MSLCKLITVKLVIEKNKQIKLQKGQECAGQVSHIQAH